MLVKNEDWMFETKFVTYEEESLAKIILTFEKISASNINLVSMQNFTYK